MLNFHLDAGMILFEFLNNFIIRFYTIGHGIVDFQGHLLSILLLFRLLCLLGSLRSRRCLLFRLLSARAKCRCGETRYHEHCRHFFHTLSPLLKYVLNRLNETCF